MEVTIDIEKLREDLVEYFEAAFLAGGFGAAMIEMEEARSASPEKLINIALNNGVDLNSYVIGKTL